MLVKLFVLKIDDDYKIFVFSYNSTIRKMVIASTRGPSFFLFFSSFFFLFYLFDSILEPVTQGSEG